MKLPMYRFGERAADSRHSRQIFNACGEHAAHASEMRQQALPAARTNTRYVLQS